MSNTEQENMQGHLKWLRDRIQDSIPPEEVRTGFFKARTNWFHAVQLRLGRMRKKGYIPSKFQEEVDQYIREIKGKGERLTTQDDLDRANELITKVLDE